MNYLLSLNKKLILYLSIILILIFISFILTEVYFSNENVSEKKMVEISEIDITLPKFSINNKNQKISITAKEGYFMNKNKILLNKEVLFKSDNFVIETDNVIFDRNKNTATTKMKTIFKSSSATIQSNGFKISDNGNKINFNGEAEVILK